MWPSFRYQFFDVSFKILYTEHAHCTAAQPAPPIVKATAHQGRANRGKLTLTYFALNTAAERGTSDETEATCHRAHNQRRRLGLRTRSWWLRLPYALQWQFISGGRRRPVPTTLPRSHSAHNVMHSPSHYYSCCWTTAHTYMDTWFQDYVDRDIHIARTLPACVTAIHVLVCL